MWDEEWMKYLEWFELRAMRHVCLLESCLVMAPTEIKKGSEMVMV